MFHRFFGTERTTTADQADATATKTQTLAGDTASVRRIVSRLEAMQPDQARLVAAAAYTIARAAYADLDISPEETAVIERQLQEHELLDEPTAVLVTEMAKLQAKTVGATEDYIVTRELKSLASPEQRLDVVRACFAVSAADDSISSEESAVVSEIANELDIDPSDLAALRDEYHDRMSAVREVRRRAGLDS